MHETSQMMRQAAKRDSSGSIMTARLLAVCLVAVATAAAQSSGGADQIGEIPLDQLGNVRVYSASRHLQTLTEAPSFATVITGDQIRKFGYRTLAEVLQSVAGFYTDYDRNYTYLGVRGFARPGDYNSRILVLVDGHRMNENVYDGAYVGTEFPLDLGLVERIEIARGPSAALYGNNAFFGVVNVVTIPPERRKGVEVSFDAESFGTYSGAARIGTSLDHNTRLLVSASASDSAGPSMYIPSSDTSASNRIVPGHADDDSFQSLLVTATHGQFRLQGLYTSREKGIPTGAYGVIMNDAGTRTLDRRAYVDLQYSKPLSDRWTISGRGYFDYYGYKGRWVYANDTGGSYLYRDYALGTWWGGDVNATVTSWKRHTVTVGSEFRINLRQDQGAYIAGEPVPRLHGPARFRELGGLCAGRICHR